MKIHFFLGSHTKSDILILLTQDELKSKYYYNPLCNILQTGQNWKSTTNVWFSEIFEKKYDYFLKYLE